MKSRAVIKNIDWVTILLYLVLVTLGWINIYSAVYNEQHDSIFDLSQRYGKQMMWILASFLLIIIVFLIDSKFYSFFAYLIYALATGALVAVLLLGREIHGAKSWFVMGPFHLQPAEFAKIGVALALARLLSSHNFTLHRVKSILKIVLVIVIPAVLIALQPDMGSTLVFAAFFLVIYREGFSTILLIIGALLIALFLAALLTDKLYILAVLVFLAFVIFWFMTRQAKSMLKAMLFFVVVLAAVYLANRYLLNDLSHYLVAVVAIALTIPVYLVYAYRRKVAAVYFIILVFAGSVIYTFSIDYVFHEMLKEHQQRRVNILLGFEDDPLGVGYNVNQSKIAIGSGGLTGKGFLMGTQTKFDFVPEQSTDFIFCTVGEEWGFVGTSITVLLFVFLLLRLIMLAERQRSGFSRIYAYGVLAVFLFHITINIGMTIGLLPVIGIPLPFFSYGGSSLWAFTILLFILIRLDASRMELVR